MGGWLLTKNKLLTDRVAIITTTTAITKAHFKKLSSFPLFPKRSREKRMDNS
jgi:hypothetical protein